MAKLYDSGVSHHMSPFRAKFMMYHEIALWPIVAADKRVFYVVGVGDLAIQVPHRKSSMPIILKETLHAPDILVTIVSVNQITKAEYTVSFKANLCKITRGDRIIGTIPISVNRLYKVDHAGSAVTPSIE